MPNTAISVSDLSKKYDDRLAVSHINFEVPLGTVAMDEETGNKDGEILEDGQEFVWVKGHAGHPQNERCDELAVQAATQAPKNIDTWFEANPN